MNPLAASVSRFGNKYRLSTATTADEVGSWFNRTYDGGYAAVPLDPARPGEAVVLSNAGFSNFQATVARWGFSAEGTTLVDQQIYCLAIPMAESCVVHDTHFGKIECHKNQGRIIRRDAGTRVTASAGNEMLYLAIPADDLTVRAKNLYDREHNEPLRFSPAIDLETNHGTAVVNLLNHLLTMFNCASDALEHEIVRANLSDQLITTVLGVLPHNYDDKPGAPIDCGVPGSVRRAEEWMRSHAHEPVTMEKLAKEAGCSERALQNAFKAFRDKTPMMVLRDIRLECAYSDLAREGARVTDVALKWGFSNLGRFAAHYEAKYFEKPSQTTKKIVA